ncbi:helicase DnaB [Paenibacillus radicis (ex Gao et al. 2016)]|uniref:Helicase DnaB n=1 Tax=Paenibacillus radicis (ex Gao et al. 2016) TaxID=1737354 RepID=A0A917HDL8_9BACL|nr:helicase DnaB [Paenibacillus radicis (ex Gao et al. 2016)]GGG75686.1 helicase DnaB [Paenibacillus radicis (ex Gao et al. 2016)]
MRIGNLLQYTEHHRYYIFRDFSLNSLDYKMLSLIYQPMIGGFSVALFQQLYHGIAEGMTGYSPIESQRKLFLGLGMDMNERGRKFLIDQASRLEAVGLLQTSRLGMPDQADVIYEYELSQPLSPAEFFRNQHLTMLLRDKIGKYAVISLREQFGAQEPEELMNAKQSMTKENISVPFYELFQLNIQSIDVELEQALSEVAPARQAALRPQLETAGIPYGDIILRFPRNSENRRYVERLRSDAEQLAQVNYVAYKYNLSVADICRLLDEDGIFSEQEGLNVDELQLRANQLYRQDKKREGDNQRTVARMQAISAQDGEGDAELDEVGVLEEYYLGVPSQLTGRCDIQQYNMLMRNEPHTRFMQRFFPGAVPDWIERTFERIDLNYRLPAPVINVLIHYVIGMNDAQRVTKTFVEAVVSNMLVKQIDNFEKAVVYVREQTLVEADKERRKEAASSGRPGTRAGAGRSAGGTSRKPSIPIVQDSPVDGQSSISPEKLEQMRNLARKLDGK